MAEEPRTEPLTPPVDYTTPPEPPALQQESTMQILADKVGFVPNTRKSDNAFQAKFTLIAAVVVAMGFIFAPGFGQNDPVLLRIGIGFLAGLLGGLLISGTILAIKNLTR